MLDNHGPIRLTASAVLVLVIAIIFLVNFGITAIANALLITIGILVLIFGIMWVYNLRG